MQITPRVKSYLMLLAVAVIWGIAGPVIKFTQVGFSTNIFLFYRFFISSLIALVIILNNKYKLPKDFKTLSLILIYAIFNSTLTLGLLFIGIENTSILEMSLLSLFGPILMMVFGYLFFHDHITSKEKIGALISFLGSIFITIIPILSDEGKNLHLFGNLMIILSLISGALSGVLVKKLMRQGLSPTFLANISFIVGFLTLIPFVWSTPLIEIVLIIKNTPIIYHFGVFYMAIISGTLAYTLSNIGQKTIELSESALFAYIHPVFASMLAVLWLGEKITPIFIIGGIIIIIGVAIAEMKKKRYNTTSRN